MTKYIVIVGLSLLSAFMAEHLMYAWYDVKIQSLQMDQKYLNYERHFDKKKLILECQTLSAQTTEDWGYESCLKALGVHPEQVEKVELL